MNSWTEPPSNVVYAGISELLIENSGARFAIVIRTPSELVGFLECRVPYDAFQEASTAVPDLIIHELMRYRDLHNEKFAGVALPKALSKQCPSLCLKLWKGLDTVPLVIGKTGRERTHADQGEISTFIGWEQKHMDEQADSVVRKCIRSFGLGHVPPVHLDLHGRVEVDSDFRVRLVDPMDYQRTVANSTWSLAQYYADDLQQRQVKVAFFGTTAHGRPDAHTRHSLIRFAHCLGVDFRWYVPRPRPELLPIIHKIAHILQGVNRPAERLTADEELHILEWVYTTAKRYWLSKGGPLRPVSEGGADIVVIDDGILSPLALISKQSDSNRPVIFENRLQIHHGQADDSSSPGYQALDFLRTRLKNANLLVSQEPDHFALRLMPEKNIGYISVAIDQLDGLNKPLQDWDASFYGRDFDSICRQAGQPAIDYPNEQYILHLSQLIHNEGTIHLLDAYNNFYHQCKANTPTASVPKLLICHYRSPNTADSTPVYASILAYIEAHMRNLTPFICLIQLRPPDQLWNVLLSKAMVLVQLGDSEGIPEMLLGAVQKDIPTIASTECRYLSFLQESGRVIFLDSDDVQGLSRHLLGLNADAEHGRQVHDSGSNTLSDKTTTVGNAVNWFFLASKLSKGEMVEPSGKNIYELAEKARELR